MDIRLFRAAYSRNFVEGTLAKLLIDLFSLTFVWKMVVNVGTQKVPNSLRYYYYYWIYYASYYKEEADQV